MLEKIKESVNYISKLIKGKPKIAVILGSGLGGFVEEIKILQEIEYKSIPHFPDTSVEGHSGILLHGSVNNNELLILQGRIHFYEGKPIEDIVYPIRVMKFLGIENLLLSNACGGMNENFNIGDLMIINDHINLIPNPLVGKHYPEFGERFPDMSEAYFPDYIKEAHNIAQNEGINIHEGIYVGVTGPTYETPAEYKYFRLIGGDVVGMSTTPEVIVAHQMGIKCFGLSVVTDLGVPGKIEYLTHEQVQIAASEAEPKLASIIKGLIGTIN